MWDTVTAFMVKESHFGKCDGIKLMHSVCVGDILNLVAYEYYLIVW